MKDNFRKYGSLNEHLRIYDRMISYYRENYAKQFIIQFGFKNWALCTSNGYMLAFNTEKTEKCNDKSKLFELGGELVLNLVEMAQIPPDNGLLHSHE